MQLKSYDYHALNLIKRVWCWIFLDAYLYIVFNNNLICPKFYLSMYSIKFRFNLILTAGENDRVENRTPADDWPKPSWMMIIKFCHTPALYPFYIMSIVSPTVWYTFCPTVISILFVHWDNWLWNRAVYLDIIIFWDDIIYINKNGHQLR